MHATLIYLSVHPSMWMTRLYNYEKRTFSQMYILFVKWCKKIHERNKNPNILLYHVLAIIILLISLSLPLPSTHFSPNIKEHFNNNNNKPCEVPIIINLVKSPLPKATWSSYTPIDFSRSNLLLIYFYLSNRTI